MQVTSEQLGIQIDYTAHHIGLFPGEANTHLIDKYVIVINGQIFDYSQGIGYRKHKYTPDSCLRLHPDCLTTQFKFPTSDEIRDLISHDTEAIPPKADDILQCLVANSDAEDMSFNDWASDFGYDMDSRKALAIYTACQDNANKLRKAGISDLKAAREAFHDY